MRRLVVLLPCLNEAAALPPLLGQLAQLRAELRPDTAVEALVVDDGSTDATPEIARAADGSAEHQLRSPEGEVASRIAPAPADAELVLRAPSGLPVHLVQHPRNLGLGAALLSGVQWFAAHCSDGDCLAAMDADGTHPPALLHDMLARLDAGAEVVIASRYAPGGSEHGLSARRKLYSHGASWLLGLAARVPGVRDYSCGYRLYTHAVLARGLARYGDRLVSERSFVCMAELLCKLGAVRARIAEAPLELHYELKAGASKMNVPVTIRRYVALVGHLLFTREFRRE